MHKRHKSIAAVLALCLLVTLAGCAGVIGEPTTDAIETAENVTARDVSESALPEETTTQAPEQTEAQTDADEDAEDYRKPTEQVVSKQVRCRTIGDITCTGLTLSTAHSLEDIIEEIAASRVTERGSRADDKRSETAMEDRKKAGYF